MSGGIYWKPNMNEAERLAYNESRREAYRTNGDYRNGRRKVSQDKLDLLAELKSQGCEVCGESRQWVLDLHHLDPKTKDRSIGGYRRFSLEKMKSESEKCIVLCSNCHRDLHHTMRLTSKGV